MRIKWTSCKWVSVTTNTQQPWCAAPQCTSISTQTLSAPCIMQHHWFMIVLYIRQAIEPKFAHFDCTATLLWQDSVSLWNEGVTEPARANAVLHRWSDIFTWVSSRARYWERPSCRGFENVSFIEADIYRMSWSSTQCDARLPRKDYAAGKIVSLVGRGWDPTHPAVMIAHLTHKTNKQTKWDLSKSLCGSERNSHARKQDQHVLFRTAL